jgi:hypothetical protein
LSGNLSPRTPSQRIAWTTTIVASTLVFIFLMVPILAIMPLSFSSGSYLTYPLPGLSVRWYEDFISSTRWMMSLKNSMIIGVASTLLSMVLGTLAALGLAQWKSKFKPLVLAVVLSPVVVPGVITAVGARVQACFAMIASLEDTNLLHRGGMSGLRDAQCAARVLLDDGGVGTRNWRERASVVHQSLIARRLSPGGSADLLAMTLFIRA